MEYSMFHIVWSRNVKHMHLTFVTKKKTIRILLFLETKIRVGCWESMLLNYYLTKTVP